MVCGFQRKAISRQSPSKKALPKAAEGLLLEFEIIAHYENYTIPFTQQSTQVDLK